MNIKLDDNDLEEIRPTDLLKSSNDKGIIHTPQVGKRGTEIPDLIKEITAIDAIDVGPTKAAEINGVPVSSASKYSNGQDLSKEARAKVLQIRYQIQDIASTKLLQTIDMLDPKHIMKTRDRIAMMTGLARVVDTIGDKAEPTQQVHLHLYSPNQKKIEEYEIIDV